VEGIADLAGEPEVMEQDGQLGGQGDDGAFLGALAAAGGDLGTPTAEIAVWAKGTEDVLSAAEGTVLTLDIGGSRSVAPQGGPRLCSSPKGGG